MKYPFRLLYRIFMMIWVATAQSIYCIIFFISHVATLLWHLNLKHQPIFVKEDLWYPLDFERDWFNQRIHDRYYKNPIDALFHRITLSPNSNYCPETEAYVTRKPRPQLKRAGITSKSKESNQKT